MNSEIRCSSTADGNFSCLVYAWSFFIFMMQLIISPSLVGHACFRVYIRIGLNYLVPTVMGMFVSCMPKS
jgi:hypothetical protein